MVCWFSKAYCYRGLHTSFIGRGIGSLNMLVRAIHPNIARVYELKSISYRSYTLSYRYLRNVLELDVFARTRKADDIIVRPKDIDYYLILEHIPSRDDIVNTLAYKCMHDVRDHVLAIRLKPPLFGDKNELEKTLSRLVIEVSDAVKNLSIPRFLVGKGRYVDPSYDGKARSIIYVAEALYRVGLVDDKLDALCKAKNYIIDSIKTLATTIKKSYFYEGLSLGSQYELVMHAIKDIVSTGVPCASLKDIASWLGLRSSFKSLSWLRGILAELMLHGKISEVKTECYIVLKE